MVAFSCLPFSRDDVHATHFQVPFLGLPGEGTMQSTSHWPFAHLSEAFNGLKPEVMLGVNFEKNHGMDGEHDGKGRNSHSGKRALRHQLKCASTTRSRTHWSPECAISPSASTKMESDKTSGFMNQADNLWEYGFSIQPLPNMVSNQKTFQCKRTKQSRKLVFASVATQSAASCKLTLKQIPLKAPLMQVKVTTKEKGNMVGALGARERTTKNEGAVNKSHLQSVHILKQLLCGGVAGVISRSMVAPLDLVKTYLITSHGLGGSQRSALSVFKEIVDSSGWQGLFRGNLVNCIRVAPNKAIELCIFEVMRRELNKDGHPLKHVAATIAGGAAGMAGTAATYPLELIRTRLSVQPELYKGILQATTKIFQEEGFVALYSGLSPSLMGMFPYAATNYYVYDGLRTTYCRSTGRQNVPTIPTLAFGAVAAAVSSTVTYPLEVARRQMQLSLTNTVKKSSVAILLDIYRHDGFPALYRGLGTTWLKLIPAAGISFVCYEAARLALSIDDASMDAKAKEACNSADEES